MYVKKRNNHFKIYNLMEQRTYLPLVSVITVCYNATTVIEATILSIIGQTYSNIEYIIIDGGSTDGTIEVIKKYEKKIFYWVSEPDKGIYDAMNKGIVKFDWRMDPFSKCRRCLFEHPHIGRLHKML